jgi:hypothetical protein
LLVLEIIKFLVEGLTRIHGLVYVMIHLDLWNVAVMPKKQKRKSKKTPPTQVAKRPRKASREEIAERRRAVMRMRHRGIGYRAIAKELGVGHMTVKRDLDIIREETQTRISRLDEEFTLASSLSVFEEVETAAWIGHNDAPKGSSVRAQFLSQIRAARNDQIKLLMDVGLIKKATQKVQHEHAVVETKVIEHWSEAAQDLVALGIVKAGLSKLPDPVPDENVPQLAEKSEDSATGTDG